MSSKRKYLYDIEAERDGKRLLYPISKLGSRFFVGDCPLRPDIRTERALKDELKLRFRAKSPRIVRDFGGE